jgi:hypothetical protein
MKFSTLILGPPGTGKSWAASTIAAQHKTLLLACKGREARSIGYTRSDNIVAEIYKDARWAPSLDRYEADAYLRLLKRLDELYDDTEYEAVIIDPFTDFAISIAHELCKAAGVGSPGDMGDTFAFYSSLKDKADEAIGLATGLTTDAAKKPKHLIVTMHVQPPKEDIQLSKKEGGGVRVSADKVARGIEYEGSVLPMIDGAYRRKMAGDFDIVVYTLFEEAWNEKTRSMGGNYLLQVSPDRDRHSKIAVGVPQTDKIPNDFAKLLEAIKC